MKWITRYSLLLCLAVIFTISGLLVVFGENIEYTPTTWTMLILIYLLYLSFYIGMVQQRANKEESSSHNEEFQNKNS